MKAKYRFISVTMSALLAFGVLAMPASASALSEDDTSYSDWWNDPDDENIVSGDFEYYVSTFEYWDEELDDYVEYEGAVIANYLGKSTNVTIPSEIDGYTVYTVDYFYNDTITTVNLPATLEGVYGNFEDFSKLEAINADVASEWFKSIDGVLYSYYYDGTMSLCAYPACKKDTVYNVPDSVEDMSFTMITNNYIEKVVINSRVNYISYDTFQGCPNLKNIEVSTDNEYLFSEDGVLFQRIVYAYEEGSDADSDMWWFEEKENISLMCYPEGKTQTSYTIPNGVEEIGVQAFCNAKLKKLVLPNTLKAIENDAFSGCENLAEFQGGDSVCYINGQVFADTAWYENLSRGEIYFGKVLCGYKGLMLNYSLDVRAGTECIIDGAFYGRIGLSKVVFPNSIKYIGAYAFAETSVTEVTIPESVEYLGSYAFGGSKLKTVTYNAVDCSDSGQFADISSLTTLNIGNKVKSIPYAMFAESGLKKVNGGENVELIGGYAFENTPWLSNQNGIVYLGKVLLRYNGTMPKNTVVTVKEGTVSISDEAFVEQNNLVDIIFPSTLEVIGDSAFMGTGLTSINLPEGIKEIGYTAFADLPEVKSVVIPKSVEYIGSDAFGACFNETEDSWETEYVENFTVYGYSYTAAQRYAEEYEFNFISLGGAVAGDVNGDGDITIDDATAIQLHIADIVNLESNILDIADVNRDNDVTIDDVTMIQLYIADIIDEL